MNEPLNRDISRWFGRDQEQEALPFQEYSVISINLGMLILLGLSRK